MKFNFYFLSSAFLIFVVPLAPSLGLCAAPATAQIFAPGALPKAHKRADDFVADAFQKKLAQNQQWLKLLHFKTNRLGQFQSEVDGAAFFLSSSGKEAPDLELEATLREFLRPASELRFQKEPDAHALCRFPARRHWLAQALGAPEDFGTGVQCPQLDWFEQTLQAKRATLVFASYYLESPASLFGHTFLRIDKDLNTQKSIPLLSHAVSFGAEPDTENPLAYAWKGLFGGFPGRYAVLPYYVKIQEYNNFESRDLWEYQIQFSPEEIKRLVFHLWELRPTSFDYYFFQANCSYQMLTLLEAAKPELELSSQFVFQAASIFEISRISSISSVRFSTFR